MSQVSTSELDQEMADFQANKGDPIPIETNPEMAQIPEQFKKKFRELAASYLSQYNRYLKAKSEADRLKTESDIAEHTILKFAKDVGLAANKTELTFTGLGKFSIKETFFGNVTKPNIGKVYAFFKDQKRESEFFQLSVRKAEINKYVREKVQETEMENPEGGANQINLPDGIDCAVKTSVSVTNRNPDFTI